MASLALRPYRPEYLERSAGGLLFHRHRGLRLPPFLHPPALDALRESWHSGPDDLLICTPQKVGTHLAKKFVVETLLALDRLAPEHPCADGDIGHGAIPWPEVVISQEGVAGWLRTLQRRDCGPRLWYCHAPFDHLPLRSIDPRTRFVVVEREPKDALVSQYFFYQQHRHLGADERHSLATYGEDFLAGRTYFGDYHAHRSGWLEASRCHLEENQVLHLRFEDMVQAKLDVLARLNRFLAPDLPLPTTTLATIAARTGFEAMKRDLSLNPRSFHFKPDQFFRSGCVGDWRRHLDPALAARVDEKTRVRWGEGLTPPRRPRESA